MFNEDMEFNTTEEIIEAQTWAAMTNRRHLRYNDGEFTEQYEETSFAMGFWD